MESSSSHSPDGTGWSSDFATFRSTKPRIVRVSLEQFVENASAEQVAAWDDSIPRLQTEVGEIIDGEPRAPAYTAILEYELPLDARRADAVFLVSGAVIVIELKGKQRPTQADLDQAAAYARDLRAYHRECQVRPVHAVLVPTASIEKPRIREGVWVTSPRALDELVCSLVRDVHSPSPDASAFLDVDAYRPCPALVQAARDLFHRGDIREVWRARERTEPAVQEITTIAKEAAATRTRHLVLVTGVPGSGKTLVGLRVVHAGLLAKLAVERTGEKPPVPALFLSGNQPLVEVLQYVLRGDNDGGKTFVRHVKSYLDAYVPRPNRVPPEHVLVFDEAQRAFSRDKVRDLHKKWPAEIVRSEPQHFVDVCERMPEWSVLVGLVGTGQEIHVGEEGGLVQWRHALEACSEPERWTVHAPADVESVFAGSMVRTCWNPKLMLDTELRFHLATGLHGFVADLLEGNARHEGASVVAERLWSSHADSLGGMRLWMTRDLAMAKAYLRERYARDPNARFGMLASSRDKMLEDHGVDNSFQTTKRLRRGPWFADGDEGSNSCRHLRTCATEFDSQGLELDMVLLCWGSDFIRHAGAWSNAHARGYGRTGIKPIDPFRLRLNAYRVLLTRGRDGMVIFVPQDAVLDETWEYLGASGFRELE